MKACTESFMENLKICLMSQNLSQNKKYRISHAFCTLYSRII